MSGVERRMRVAFVGGIGRLERELVEVGAELGVDVEVHDGRTRSAARDRLASIVHRMDVVVLVMGVNSHGAVAVVKREARKTGATIRMLKSCGTSSARLLLAEIVNAAA